MRTTTHITFGVLVLLASQCLVSSVRGQEPLAAVLRSGEMREARITSRAAHTYQLTLAANEYARIEVTQEQTRLQLSLLSAQQELIAAVSNADAPGMKYLDIVAERATTYFIRVATETPRTPSGKYRLQVTEQRAATAQDREWFALHILNWEVVTLYRQQEKAALQQAAAKGLEAAARWQVLGDNEQAGRMFDRAGQCYLLLSEAALARENFQRALAAYRQAGSRKGEAMVRNHLVILLYYAGEYNEVVAQFLQMHALWQAAGDAEGLRLGQFQQARAYRFTGDWQKAEDLSRQLLPHAHADRVDDWDTLYQDDLWLVLGTVAVAVNEPRRGLPYLEAALAQTRASRVMIYEGQITEQLGHAWLKLGDRRKALDWYQQGLTAYRQMGFRFGEAEILNDLGAVHFQMGDRKNAEAEFKQAAELAAAVGSKRSLALAQLGRARIWQTQGRLQDALTATEEAIRLVEGLRSAIPHQPTRATFLALGSEVYEFRTEVLMQLHRREPVAGFDAVALRSSEYARARSLIENIGNSSITGLSPALTARVTALQQQIAAKTSEQISLRQDSATPARAEAVQLELAQLLAEFVRATTILRQSNPHLAQLVAPEPLKLRDIQQQVLDRDTLLLEYELGEERSYLFAVTQDALQTYELPARKVIEPLARKSYELLSRSQQPNVFSTIAARLRWLQQAEREYARTATQLSGMLLSPVKELARKRRLLIVTEGMLQYVPFAALPESAAGGRWSVVGKNQNQPPVTSHQPLIENHEIINLPSATTLAVLRGELAGRTAAPKTLLVIADPVFSANDDRVKTAPLNATKKTVAADNDFLRALGKPDKTGAITLPRLPASRTEAEAILALVPETARRAVLDFDANREAALQAVNQDYRYIHFATHGLLNEARPELSGLVLSQVNHAGEPQNGILTALDAFNLKLSAELVVLSGCQTALGQEVRGEGLVGLTRGFMSAGARRVLASLWQVNDAATAELMQRFYQGMLGEQRLQPAAALRAAQLSLLRDKRWQSPYYWAAFVLQGEW